jgi:transcriptional regulator GlxA family with amidase domain
MVNNVTSKIESKLRVVILALSGAPLSSIAVPMDVFSSAALMSSKIFDTPVYSPFDVRLASVDGKSIPLAGGISIGAHSSVDEIDAADLVLISALVRTPESLKQLPRAISWLKAAYAGGSRIAGLCTGAFILAGAGLLDGKRATTHWGACRRFNALFPKVKLLPHRLIVDEAPLYTSGGSHGASDLCFYLVEKMVGPEVARRWSRVLVKEFRSAPQSPYAVFIGNRKHDDATIAAIQDYLEEGYARPLSVDAMARRAGLGKRTFERRFKAATGETPVSYLQQLRVEAAKRILEMENQGVEQITVRVGYEDSATFSRLFSRFVGIPPAAYRRKFASTPPFESTDDV